MDLRTFLNQFVSAGLLRPEQLDDPQAALAALEAIGAGNLPGHLAQRGFDDVAAVATLAQIIGQPTTRRVPYAVALFERGVPAHFFDNPYDFYDLKSGILTFPADGTYPETRIDLNIEGLGRPLLDIDWEHINKGHPSNAVIFEWGKEHRLTFTRSPSERALASERALVRAERKVADIALKERTLFSYGDSVANTLPALEEAINRFRNRVTGKRTPRYVIPGRVDSNLRLIQMVTRVTPGLPPHVYRISVPHSSLLGLGESPLGESPLDDLADLLEVLLVHSPREITASTRTPFSVEVELLGGPFLTLPAFFTDRAIQAVKGTAVSRLMSQQGPIESMTTPKPLTLIVHEDTGRLPTLHRITSGKIQAYGYRTSDRQAVKFWDERGIRMALAEHLDANSADKSLYKALQVANRLLPDSSLEDFLQVVIHNGDRSLSPEVVRERLGQLTVVFRRLSTEALLQNQELSREAPPAFLWWDPVSTILRQHPPAPNGRESAPGTGRGSSGSGSSLPGIMARHSGPHQAMRMLRRGHHHQVHFVRDQPVAKTTRTPHSLASMTTAPAAEISIVRGVIY